MLAVVVVEHPLKLFEQDDIELFARCRVFEKDALGHDAHRRESRDDNSFAIDDDFIADPQLSQFAARTSTSPQLAERARSYNDAGSETVTAGRSRRFGVQKRCARGLRGSMDAREKRLAENESLFRAINEQIEQAAVSGGADQHLYEFFCECSNADCSLLLPMTTSEYEEIRANPTRFVVAPGHELPEIETVVLRRAAYQIVTKRGEAADFVAERNPRA